jgi:hypothetical protein
MNQIVVQDPQWEVAMRADCDRGLVTLGQWVDLWLEMRQTLSFSTRRIYTQHVRDYPKPRLGGCRFRS